MPYTGTTLPYVNCNGLLVLLCPSYSMKHTLHLRYPRETGWDHASLSYLVAGLSLRWFGLNPRPDHVGFVVDGVTLGQVFSRVLWILPIFVIPPMLHTHSVVCHQCCIMFSSWQCCWMLRYKWKRNLMVANLCPVFNPLMPNDHYSCRTAPLTSKRCILYIYSTNISTEYFKHGIYSPFISPQNAVCFIILAYLVPVLFTFYIQGALKLKK
jgi:hypothetical protein